MVGKDEGAEDVREAPRASLSGQVSTLHHHVGQLCTLGLERMLGLSGQEPGEEERVVLVRRQRLCERGIELRADFGAPVGKRMVQSSLKRESVEQLVLTLSIHVDDGFGMENLKPCG